jgi:adenine deaminase
MPTERAELIAVARGDKPADLILADAWVVNVFNGQIEAGNVAIYGNTIAGVGDYTKATKMVDLGGRYLAPGLINGHTHIESSMLDIGQYARAVVPRGTLAVITDLHELANVTGLSGLRCALNSARRLPLDVYLLAPSCVPATEFETAGAKLGAEDIGRLVRWQGVIGLGEVMNFPGVIGGDQELLQKIILTRDMVLDGHAPGLKGRELTAYIAAGIGSDHESVTLAEACEKLRQGMYIMIREGSSEKNLKDLLPLVTDKTYKRCFFVVDDRSAIDLLRDGDMDAVVRKAISLGLEPVRAIQLATINAAEYFHLPRLGAVAPGYRANLITIDDLSSFMVNEVFHDGRLVARRGQPLFLLKRARKRPDSTVNIKPFGLKDLRLSPLGESMSVIEVVPGQIITRRRLEKVKIVHGAVVADTSRDILKLVVVERHRGSGNIGRGLVNGFDLKKGALASSIAHDSHNIIAVGTSDEDIFTAIKEVEKLKGGLAVATGGRVVASLALPIAGLMSNQSLEEVVAELETLQKLATGMGTKLASPFATLSFLALPVIPELRLTDKGLVDVNAFKLVE